MDQPAISVVLLADSMPTPPAALSAALASGAVREVIPAVGRFDRLAPAFAEALGRCEADLVLPLTLDAELDETTLAGIVEAAAAHPDAVAIRLPVRGLPRDPAWRGRRARRLERNLESLRFANLLPPGSVAFRRAAAMAVLGRLDPNAGADWWRQLVAGLAETGAVAAAQAGDRGGVRRRRLSTAEPSSPGFAPPAPRDAHAPSVLVFGPLEASTSLYFDFLQSVAPSAVRFRAPTRLAVDAPHLAAADLVILVRELHRFHDEGVIELLERLGVPYVYFTDDNLQILHGEGLASRFYRPRRIAAAFAGAAEVWASTPALAEALRPLHPRVRTWGPVLDPRLAPRAGARPVGGALTIAFAGGDFRLPGLHGAPITRLRALARAQDLRVVLTPAAARQLARELAEARIIVAPVEPSFRQFIRHLRALGVDILLHPAGATANAPFKCPTAAITAGYLGAIPLVGDEPAYVGWDEADGLLRLGPEAEGLDAAVAAATNPELRRRLADQLTASLARRFSDVGRLELMATLARPPRDHQRTSDGILASPRFQIRRAALRLARATRWLTDVAGLR